ncbi:MAG: HAD family hydrolase [Candidatus Bathyarchaeia archaeon]|nr:HAD-IA family hydrolase [Candidatus Bathyarchaeota archaeon A05DMB-4]MDH7595796.1 HAD-IA family hydrolase [Candidatus Bathyarchaeota archaeon]
MIEAAIFDLDGTLVNLPIDYEGLYAEFKKITGKPCVEPVTKTIAELNPTLKKRVFETWTNMEFAALPRMTIVEEGMTLYQQYRNLPRALVTMQGKKTVQRILEALTLSFNVIITREDSLDRITQIKMAMERLRLKPENVIVIGDRETDKTAAETVGCKFKMVKN